jgi:nitroreductase
MTTDRQRLVDETIDSRRSVRAFLPTPVPRETLEEILRIASRAPSGTNVQPWKVYVLTGSAKEQLSQKILAAYNDPEEAQTHTEEYPYYPAKWVSPYIDRRRKVGLDLYGLLDIKKGDAARMHAQHGRNYTFFDAPVGLIFTIDRIMQQGSWFDYGMFVQTIMLAAPGRLHPVPPHHRRTAEPAGKRDGGVRHGPGLCGRKQAGEQTAHRARAPGRVGAFLRLRQSAAAD